MWYKYVDIEAFLKLASSYVYRDSTKDAYDSDLHEIIQRLCRDQWTTVFTKVIVSLTYVQFCCSLLPYLCSIVAQVSVLVFNL